MIYFTYAEPYSGVLSGQAIDVCRYLRAELKVKIRLIMFISVRNYFAERSKIKKEFPSAWVIPMSPKLSSWKLNSWPLAFICLITGERKIIARNVLAANIAFKVKKMGLLRTVCYDGRGAMTAEWTEYKLVPSEEVSRNILQLEANAVIKSDFRIAVSSRLVTYWQNTFEYNTGNHVVIPCTLHSSFVLLPANEKSVLDFRKKWNYNSDDCILVYSGSLSGWQSFHILTDFLQTHLAASAKNKILFLSEKNDSIKQLTSQFPQQVKQTWLKHSDVQEALSACDYGLMIRENAITNSVASPTKFAEYLSAGLKIITSDNLGDYTDFVQKHQCGIIVKTKNVYEIKPLTIDERNSNIKLAEKFFTKKSHEQSYKLLVQKLKGK